MKLMKLKQEHVVRLVSYRIVIFHGTF